MPLCRTVPVGGGGVARWLMIRCDKELGARRSHSNTYIVTCTYIFLLISPWYTSGLVSLLPPYPFFSINMGFPLLRAWWRFGGGWVLETRPSRRRRVEATEGSRKIYCEDLMKGSMVMEEVMSQLLVLVLLLPPPRGRGQGRRMRIHS